mgnify:FL=1|uniref:Intron associated endonuclease n=1 Tax=Siphoviridae sp. ctLqe90 TaxID=2825456 RepID=A0A8S5Q3L2_9CAUD|nr:MAG TPA: intron associated endonuclease [Siphoviridae sp. ctLqe90]
MEEDRTYKIYCYTNLLNGKKYIGRTKQTLTQRAGKDGKKYYGCLHFGYAIKKDGWENFFAEILEDELTYEEACEKEKEYISKFETSNPKKGYNLQKGGEGPNRESLEKMRKSHEGKHLSEEHKKHISEGLGQRINNVNYGRKMTQEAIENIRKTKTGSNHPNWGKHRKESTKEKIREKNSRKVKQLSLNGEFIKEWNSGKEAAQELGINYLGINNCLRHTRHSSGGFVWEYVDKEMDLKYAKNKELLESVGIRAMEKEIKRRKQEQSSTTIPEMGVE